jgi:TonB family protein
MDKYAFRVALASLAVSAAVRTIAQTPAPAQPAPAVWDLEFQDSRCTITTGDKRTIGLAVWMTPGQPEGELYLIGSPKMLPRNIGKKLTVVLEPRGGTFRADVYHRSDRDPTILSLTPLPDTFPAAFAKAQEVRLIGGATPLSIPVPAADKAMAALQGCIDDALREWGIDPKAFAELRKPPTIMDDNLILAGDDYPRDAFDNNVTGTVVMRLHVDATGRVQDCAVVVSSGSKLLDNPTCILMLKKGRFDPAIGADGKPTAAPRVFRAEWTIQ